jgi:NADPH-dependent glutamate synthase beta subunit-like oxidoreductase/formate hydrogenlyase subunit 6/NADH:ubiquinone oxidoreductase subunit I
MIRTVDQTKCIGCGACQKICPLDVFRMDVKQSTVSPCINACPIEVDIRELNYLLAEGYVDKASQTLFESNPLASITGRVCPNFCESDCSRNKIDEALNFGAIEQFLGDYDLQKSVDPVPRQHIAPVAVIGSGPAGLSCAYFLALQGFDVTIFEAKDETGGMLRYGIPEFRLPINILASFMERLQKMGVSIKCGQVLGKDFTLEELTSLGFGSVFLGMGTGKSKLMQVTNEDASGVYYGLDFLEKARTGRLSKVGPRVLVVGGGDVAMDAAQSAMVFGAESVTVVTLEDESNLPAYNHNVETAKFEGINFINGSGVEEIITENGKVASVNLVKCLSVFNEKREFSPTFEKGTSRQIETDNIIIAIGQEPDLDYLPTELLNKDRLINVNKETYQTSVPKIFAAGDAVTGPGSVAEAVGGGKRAALAISWFLIGRDLGGLSPRKQKVVDVLPDSINQKKTIRNKRFTIDHPGRKGASRSSRGFDLLQTLAESNRCMTCGGKAVIAHLDDCMTCFSCELNCPSAAIFVHPFKEILPRSLRPI